ncbi:MAG: biotin--[acetyl-CoA-carboxylase] ligase [Bacteroidetes bacterium]|nr:MAG: biotin--[acetyl-CoA-carboxylase] ligase [Bacteroidota bacterium]
MNHTQFVGRNFIYLDELPSTNTFAMELLTEEPAEGTVVQAGHQSRGRGQAGNHWHAAAGENLTLSVILYPAFLGTDELFYLSKISSLAIHACVSALLPGEEVLIKWPNDVLVNRRKVAGILIENQLEGKAVKASVLGIGLNVNQQAFPPEIRHTACSLRQLRGSSLSLQEVAARLFEELEAVYLRLRAGHRAAIDRSYLTHLYGYQTPVPMRIDGTEVQAMPVGVEQSGRLAVAWGERLRYFELKEVEFILAP